MARKHVHFVLPLLLLVGAAAPAQAAQTMAVGPADCMPGCASLQEGTVALGVDGALAQAMANSTECRSAVHVIVENFWHHGAVVEVQDCLGDVALHVEEQDGLYIMTSTRVNAGSEGGSEGGSCSSIYLGNLLNQIGNPDDAVFNSIEIDLGGCPYAELVWSLIRPRAAAAMEIPE